MWAENEKGPSGSVQTLIHSSRTKKFLARKG